MHSMNLLHIIMLLNNMQQFYLGLIGNSYFHITLFFVRVVNFAAKVHCANIENQH